MQAEDNRARRISFWGVVEAGSALACLATVTGFLGKLAWLLELTSHFRVQLGVALILLAALWLVRRRWWLAGLCGAFAVVNSVLVLALVWPAEDVNLASGARLRLSAINVHTSNERSDLVLDWLKQVDADVLLLMGVDGGGV